MMVTRIWIAIGMILLCGILIVGGFLLYVTLTDYKPEEIVTLTAVNNQQQEIEQGKPLSITTFNIGYAGLDRDQDFFLDGGTLSRSSSKKQTEINLEAITSFMKGVQSDLFLIQEIDVRSSRSYKLNQVKHLSEQLPQYGSIYADTYIVPWVPVPVFDPMGSAHSGMMTLSTFKTIINKRYDLPGKESWPRQLFDVDRAFIETRLPVQNGKELILINLHLSAFDKGGNIRKQQLEYLFTHVKKEYDTGNYIILGGDWNHSLPGTDPKKFRSTQEWPFWLYEFPDEYRPKGFKWAVDADIPSVRTVDVAYTEGVNFRGVIDGFLVSPNVEVLTVQGHDLNHEHSDHNPVTTQFILQ